MRTAAPLLVLGILIPCGTLATAAEKPVAWWKFETAAARQAPIPWTADGKRGGALAFDGGTAVTVGEIGTFDALTIALWVRAGALEHPYNALLACNGWDRSMVHFQFARDGRVEFSVNGNDPADAFSAAAPGADADKWHHVAVTYDSKGRKVRFYLDGKGDGEVAYKSAVAARLSALRLGAWDREPRFLSGRLDDVRVYSRALDDAAVAKVAAGEEVKDGLEAWWRMDEKDGTKVADASGKGRDGTLLTQTAAGATTESTSGADDEIRGPFAFVPGVNGKAMRFGGATAVVHKAAADSKINPDGFSIEAWVALPAYPRGGCEVVQQRAARRGYLLAIDGRGHFSLAFALGSEWKSCESLGPIPLRKWAHLAATYSPDSGINLYINGKPQGNLILLGSIWLAEDADLAVGRSFEGLLDDLVIHNAELSPREVLKHYEAGKSAPDPAFAP